MDFLIFLVLTTGCQIFFDMFDVFAIILGSPCNTNKWPTADPEERKAHWGKLLIQFYGNSTDEIHRYFRLKLKKWPNFNIGEKRIFSGKLYFRVAPVWRERRLLLPRCTMSLILQFCVGRRRLSQRIYLLSMVCSMCRGSWITARDWQQYFPRDLQLLAVAPITLFKN